MHDRLEHDINLPRDRVVDNTFRCAGIVRIMAALFKRRLRKQTEGFMQRFKAYAERNG